jgi:hypothetical protein
MPLSQVKAAKIALFEDIFSINLLQGAAQYASWMTKGD